MLSAPQILFILALLVIVSVIGDRLHHHRLAAGEARGPGPRGDAASRAAADAPRCAAGKRGEEQQLAEGPDRRAACAASSRLPLHARRRALPRRSHRLRRIQRLHRPSGTAMPPPIPGHRPAGGEAGRLRALPLPEGHRPLRRGGQGEIRDLRIWDDGSRQSRRGGREGPGDGAETCEGGRSQCRARETAERTSRTAMTALKRERHPALEETGEQRPQERPEGRGECSPAAPGDGRSPPA